MPAFRTLICIVLLKLTLSSIGADVVRYFGESSIANDGLTASITASAETFVEDASGKVGTIPFFLAGPKTTSTTEVGQACAFGADGRGTWVETILFLVQGGSTLLKVLTVSGSVIPIYTIPEHLQRRVGIPGPLRFVPCCRLLWSSSFTPSKRLQFKECFPRLSLGETPRDRDTAVAFFSGNTRATVAQRRNQCVRVRKGRSWLSKEEASDTFYFTIPDLREVSINLENCARAPRTKSESRGISVNLDTKASGSVSDLCRAVPGTAGRSAAGDQQCDQIRHHPELYPARRTADCAGGIERDVAFSGGTLELTLKYWRGAQASSSDSRMRALVSTAT
ncbi:hypothetical protein B0H19DRAFT_1080942 [Mycena capillaripes]|nr:hypothetical protein B0H19DRAFT_1080942 [Mycena capillaripes]